MTEVVVTGIVLLVVAAAVAALLLTRQAAGADAGEGTDIRGPGGPVVSVPTGPISRNFRWAEFFGVETQAPQVAVKNTMALVAQILQPARDQLGKPIIVNSGFRTIEKNEATASAATKSAHLFGAAADIKTADPADMNALHNALFRRPFGELILYKVQTTGPTVWVPRWIHVSLGGFPTYNKVLSGWVDRSGRLTFSTGGQVGTGERP